MDFVKTPPHSITERARAIKVILSLVAGVFLTFTPSALAAASLTASLDRDTTSVGESVALSLVFEGGTPSQPPNVPAPQGLSIQYAGQSSEFSINNGQTTSKLILNYVVIPNQAGDFIIPSIRSQAGNQVLTSKPLTLKVVKGQIPVNSSGNTNQQIAFIQLLPAKKEVYIGEVLPVEIRLYFQYAENIQLNQLQAEGFSIGKSVNTQPTRTQIGNQIYTVASVRLSVTPVKTGDLILGPAQCQLTLVIPQTTTRRRDPFGMSDDLFGMFGSSYVRRPAVISSDPQTIRVLPLPAQGAPADFTGVVGSFDMTVQAAPTNVVVGDPITIKARITGQGPLDAIALPSLVEGQPFKSYPPTSKVETQDPLGIKGAKNFECVVIPQSPDVKALPPVRFSFFDPEQKIYRTLQPPPIPLTVRPAATAPPPPSLAGATAPDRQRQPPQQDIVNIKSRLGTVSLIQPPLIQRSWFIALQGVPLLAWLAASYWRRRADNLNRNPRLRRQREVARVMREGRKELRRQAEANDSDLFFANAFHLMQEQLGERLDLPASAITEAVLDERLRPCGVSESILALLHEVFQRCNQVRYAPRQTSEGLYQYLPKVESALNALEAIKLEDK